MQNFANCFQKYSVNYTKQLLWDINRKMQTQIAANEHARAILGGLLTDQASVEEESK